MSDDVNWKVYEMYCISCCRNKMSPLSFDEWLFLVSDEEVEAE